MSSKSLEQRLRRKAKRMGYYITKARGQQHINNRGHWQIVNTWRNEVAEGVNYEIPIEQLDEWLDRLGPA